MSEKFLSGTWNPQQTKHMYELFIEIVMPWTAYANHTFQIWFLEEMKQHINSKQSKIKQDVFVNHKCPQ